MEIIANYFLLALCYAFGGWICEEITCSISEKKLVDRGFLIGPVCPIYGWGGLFITLALTRFSQYPVVVSAPPAARQAPDRRFPDSCWDRSCRGLPSPESARS